MGGLYKSMPQTAALCVVGAASISAFPLFSGFATKSMIIEGVGQQHLTIIWLMLLYASAGVFHHAGIKIPYFAFFAHDSGKRCAEAPANMLVAMAIAAALCVGIGVYPAPLYAMLPFPVDYVPYTPSHVLTQLQLLAFSALAFSVLMRTGVYPPEQRLINLDSDYLYRGLAPRILRQCLRLFDAVHARAALLTHEVAHAFGRALRRGHGPEGILARTWPTGSMALWVMLMLLAYLLLYYL